MNEARRWISALGTDRAHRVLVMPFTSLLLLLLVASVSSHITTVCTVTAPSVPGIVWFVFSTYHVLSDPDGAVIIKRPNGETHVSSWGTTRCPAAANYLGTCPGPDIKAQCTGGPDGLPNDSEVTCYKGNDPNSLVSVEDGGCDAFPWTSGTFSESKSSYYAKISGATSGDYHVISNTTDFDMCPVQVHAKATYHAACMMTASVQSNCGLCGCRPNTRDHRPQCRNRWEPCAAGSLPAVAKVNAEDTSHCDSHARYDGYTRSVACRAMAISRCGMG